MDIWTIVATTTSAVVGGTVTGSVLKILDRRHAVRTAVQVEVAKTSVLQHLEAIAALKGEINDLAHQLQRVRHSPHRYAAGDVEARSLSVRSLARAKVAVLGDPVVARVHDLTDALMVLATQAGNELADGGHISKELDQKINDFKRSIHAWEPQPDEMPPTVGRNKLLTGRRKSREIVQLIQAQEVAASFGSVPSAGFPLLYEKRPPTMADQIDEQARKMQIRPTQPRFAPRQSRPTPDKAKKTYTVQAEQRAKNPEP